jgi:hypothetical protein
MVTSSDRNIKHLCRRIQAVLQDSFDWVAWQRALEATMVDEYLSPGAEVLYCADTSIVVEFLLPRSRAKREDEATSRGAYPRPKDLALLLLFGSSAPIHILPPHRREFDHKIWVWHQRLLEQKAQLAAFQDALQAFIVSIDAAEQQVNGEEGAYDQVIEAILREESRFGQVLALETEGLRSLEQIVRRLHTVALDSVRILLEQRTPDGGPGPRVEALYEAISFTHQGSETPFNNRVDAHALYILEEHNAALGERSYLVLLTESWKIWSLLANEKLRQEARFDNRKGKVWLVQTPEVMLVAALVEALRGDRGEEEVRRELTLELEQNLKLRELRDRLERALAELDRPNPEEAVIEEAEGLVQQMELGFRTLGSAYQARDRLRAVRLAIEAPESWGENFFARLRALRGQGKKELQAALLESLSELSNRVCEIEQQLVIAAPEPPIESESFDYQEPLSVEEQGILRSQPGGTAYFIRFQSERIQNHLRSIEEFLHLLDATERKSPERRKVEAALQAAMRQAQRECSDDPEYRLLRSSIYCSRRLWFEAYVAADLGLRFLEKNRSQGSPEAPEVQFEKVRFELLLMKAAARHSWGLERYGDLPVLVGQFLRDAARCLRSALDQADEPPGNTLLGSAEDPRALRELATIYGNALVIERFSRDGGVLPTGSEEIFPVESWGVALIASQSNDEPTLLNVYLGLAERAYREASKTPSMRAYYVNTLLYALVEKGDAESLRQAKNLAFELADSNTSHERVNFLDTLAWFHFRRSQQAALLGEDRDTELSQARSYILRAKQVSLRGKQNRFLEKALRFHEAAIESA